MRQAEVLLRGVLGQLDSSGWTIKDRIQDQMNSPQRMVCVGKNPPTALRGLRFPLCLNASGLDLQTLAFWLKSSWGFHEAPPKVISFLQGGQQQPRLNSFDLRYSSERFGCWASATTKPSLGASGDSTCRNPVLSQEQDAEGLPIFQDDSFCWGVWGHQV